MLKTAENCKESIDACTKTLSIFGRNEKLLLWCAQITKSCGGWTNSYGNLNSDQFTKAFEKNCKTLIGSLKKFLFYAGKDVV